MISQKFYITYLNCDNTTTSYTVEMDVPHDSDFSGHGFNESNDSRRIILSIYTEDELNKILDSGNDLPPEIQAHFDSEYTFDMDKFAPPPPKEDDKDIPWGSFKGEGDDEERDDDTGDEWKKLL